MHDVRKIYQSADGGVAVQALRGITTTIFQGDYIAIVGASGSGKSTLMNLVGCLDRPTSGQYFLHNEDVSTLDDDALSDVRGRRIGFIFQQFNLIQHASVLENIEVPAYYLGVPADERRERAAALAAKVGLADRLHHRPNQLSGGQQQRVAIARSMVNDPVLLLADEPTGALDSKTGKMILELLDELQASGRTIVVVTHDQHVADHCHRAIELRDGLIVNERNGRP